MPVKPVSSLILVLLCLSLGACVRSSSRNPDYYRPSGETIYVAPTAVPEIAAEVPDPRTPADPSYTPTPDSPHPIPGLRTGEEEYVVQAGDTLGRIAEKFNISVAALAQVNQILDVNVLEIGQLLTIPAPQPAVMGPKFKLIPDSELVAGPLTADLDVASFIKRKNGYLVHHEEEVDGQVLSGIKIVKNVARDFSVNPRVLLAIIEYQCRWVTDPNPRTETLKYPLGWRDPWREGLYKQLSWAANNLNRGYYWWRVNAVSSWTLADNTIVPVNPTINAGTAAVQYFFGQLYSYKTWQKTITAEGFYAVYIDLFGYPFGYTYDPLVPENLDQPPLQLPFEPGVSWAFTGGPHGGWGDGSAWSALDFAPFVDARGCFPSGEWVVAVADGLVVRSEDGAVVQDLDGDGKEQTGWTILYMHIGTQDRVKEGAYLKAGDPIGHPSCEGGVTNGTHVHIARRYNGEWISADQGLPFVMDGWESAGTSSEYNGTLQKKTLSLKLTMVISPQTRFRGKMKLRFPLLLVIFLVGLLSASCNPLGGQLGSIILASGHEQEPTPNWAATLEAAVPATPVPEQEAEPTLTPTPTQYVPPPPSPTPISTGPILYYTQAGDTLDALAVRFNVGADEITSPELIDPEGFINPNQLLVIPNNLSNTTFNTQVLPDSEFVFSVAAADFDVRSYVKNAGGYLNGHHEYLGTNGETYGADVIRILAQDNSINPRLLLALLEYQSGWVTGSPANQTKEDYPMGQVELAKKGLLRQLKWTVNQLSIGYYGWREGRLSEIRFRDGVKARLAPGLNAGTAALQYYFSQIYDSQAWIAAMDEETGFPALYETMFGSPWSRAYAIEPLFPPDLTQPYMVLPFLIGPVWSYTGGPHGAWERDGSWAAIDFAPASVISGCYDSDAWVAASAAGMIVRSERGIVTLDLDGDGLEQTGWVLIYLHIPEKDRVEAGTIVKKGDFLGHPSCEGGYATGTHIHIARRFNGEWMAADGPISFSLSGWVAHAGSSAYKGTLTRDGETVTASQVGAAISKIVRDKYGSEE